MLILRYAAATVLLTLGAWATAFDAWVLIGILRRKKMPSVVPFVGGFFLYYGALAFPNEAVQRFAWLGFFVDYGCVPYLCVGLTWVEFCLARNRWLRGKWTDDGGQ